MIPRKSSSRMAEQSPYTAGPRLSEEPRGDPAAQAIASLRGYAYQLYATALAWLALEPDQLLVLEVAKDYAVVAGNALHAVESKDTGPKTVTINSDDVQETLDGFVDLVGRNPNFEVFLRFLSTSQIGKEKTVKDRADGKPVLDYWRQAAAGADVAPLRTALLRSRLTERVRAFVEPRDDEALRRDLLKRIHWDCGQPGLDTVKSELQLGLIRSGRLLQIPMAEAERLSGPVLQHVLETALKPESRKLRDTDLTRLMSDATRISIPRSQLETFMEALASGAVPVASGQAVVLTSTGTILDDEDNIPLPPFLASRPLLVDLIGKRTRANGVAFVVGGTGLGKTTLARLAARTGDGLWHVLDLRNASAQETVEKINLAVGPIAALKSSGVICDDFNEVEDPTVRRAFVRLLASLRRRDSLCIVTSYREPSARARADLGLEDGVSILVPDMTVEEVAETITAAGGDGARWALPVHVAGSFGHPQLVQAIVVGLRSRGWTEIDLGKLAKLDASSDVTAARQAVRQHLVSVLSDDEKELLYRVSLLIGRFDRRLALAVSDLIPRIARPGERLEGLIGPWVDQISQDQLRVSPLLLHAGKDILSEAQQLDVHRTAAEKIGGGLSIDITKADACFLHAIKGKAEEILMKLAYSVVAADTETRKNLFEWFTSLRLQRFDRPLFGDRPALSKLLRFAQMLLVAEGGEAKTVTACWRALVDEDIGTTDREIRDGFESMILSKMLPDQTTAGMLPDWVGLILRFAELSRGDHELGRLVEEMGRSIDGKPSPSPMTMFFIVQCLGIISVKNLSAVFDRLDGLSASERTLLLAEISEMPSDYSLIVNQAWLKEHDAHGADRPAAAAAYQKMAVQAFAWGYRRLALRCEVARAVILDEYVLDPPAASAALEEAEQLLGPDPVLTRAKAKILYRQKKHVDALDLFRDLADSAELSNPVERIFLLREAGISAAEAGDWSKANEWFRGAREIGDGRTLDGMRAMIVGLSGDESVAAMKTGDRHGALLSMKRAVEQLNEFNGNASVKPEYCRRVVGHTALWLYGEITGHDVRLDDQHFAVVPGMCSNPEPPDLRDRPAASLEYLWYFLADAEMAADVDVGITRGLEDRPKERSIPSMEIQFKNSLLSREIRRLDVDGFIRRFSAMAAKSSSGVRWSRNMAASNGQPMSSCASQQQFLQPKMLFSRLVCVRPSSNRLRP
jgi:hypothetical protein